ncbi:efflux RND transporter permease subunit [Halalkalibacter hemicellulosilyticus]|uniref:RND multidrug efflux transporter n=1 Tax=Halalkalibacter hemicellulosilyticusJCM 9152 TaxID=1236971 RepID=W4QGU0_9BACI|nr:efflux RND transporter permease subunit [Halalkalibacter hemicellulosilyticus]GAE31325.1 RND multidrug efflux transporter [Halalkalibacter hemicellulosilyticusJCM 9152]
MRLVETSVKRPVGVIMLVLAALVLGGISLKNLSIDLFPNIDVPVAVIATSYQGAAPQEMEQLVTRPVESAVGSIEGVQAIDSMSSAGSSLVILQFDWGRNIDESMNTIRERVDQVVGALPEDAGRPSILRFDPQQLPVMWVGVSGASPDILQQLAESDIQPAFERVDGVASVSIEGGLTREIQVQMDQARLASYGLNGTQIVQAISAENQSVSAGTLERGTQDLQLRINGDFTTVEDIGDTPVMLPSGGTITVNDVANVTDTFRTPDLRSEVNGSEAVVLSIMKQSDGNTVEVADNMYRAIEQVQAELADSEFSVDVIIDTSDFIRQSIASVVNNMLIGAVLSIIVLLVFLRSIRTTLVIGISIPIAIISTFTLMYFTGETLNVLSMGGLALGLGMMVDSSIVILENIFSKRQQGYSMIEAAKEGGSELASAVLASTLTSVVVFLPIVFVEGLASEIFRPLAYTVAFALFASLVVSLTLIPMLSSKLLSKVKVDEPEEKKGFDRWFEKATDVYERVLNWALIKRKTTVALTGLAIVASLALTPFIGMSFIPEADQGQVQMNVVTQTGTRLAELDEIAERVNGTLQPYEEIIDTSYAMIGGSSQGMGGGSSEIEFIIQLVHPSDRSMTTEEFVQSLSEEMDDLPGAETTIATVDAGLGGGSPIQIDISGPDLDVLEDLAQQVMWMIEDNEGITNVDSTVNEGSPELQIVVDRDMAAQYGLTQQQVMSEIMLGYHGQVATRYREAGNEFDVRVILPEEFRQTIQDVETLMIHNQQGAEIPLSSIAELRQIQGPTEINRSNQQREVRVTSDLVGVDLGTATTQIERQLERMNKPDGYTMSIGGQSQEMIDAFEQLILAFLLSIFLVYMVMAIQFESFLFPFIIMFSLPTMLVGVLGGLFITNEPLSVPAFVGVIMLAGIVVNNAIVLVSYINILREKGFDRHEAIIESGRSRLRPIFMTTLTTALAMVPLALGLGQGAEAQTPMAVVIIFGLMASTIFTLILIPVMYIFFDNLSKRIGSFSFRRKRKQEVDPIEE